MIVDKIKKREQVARNIPKKVDIPVGKWLKCDKCKEILYKETVRNNYNICPNCGAYQQQGPQTPPVVDNGGIGWGILGCCIPIVGLVLFLVWKDTKPRTAKAAGIGALVAVILYALYYLIVFTSAITIGFLS